jgi:ribokinase
VSAVLVLGSYVQDHCWSTDTLPRPGESRIGRFSIGPGGKGFNQAVAAHRLGAPTRFFGAVGDDALAQTARNFAAAEGLPCEWFSTSVPTAASSIIVDAAGRNQICVALGANDALPMLAVEALAMHFAAGAILVTQLETALAPVAAALRAARASGATTLLNPAPINALVDHQLIELADILTPNETEFCYLLEHLHGERIELDPHAMDAASVHRACRRLCPAGTVVITLGDAGALVSHADAQLRGDAQSCYLVPPAAVTAIDTTGAGDAFSGALAAALLDDRAQAFEAKVRFACKAAGLSTERAGTAPAMPDRTELAARFG